MDPELAKKYDSKAFMYVEYPHKSFWTQEFDDSDYRAALKNTFTPQKNSPTLLYVHTLHCLKQCYFCTCHTAITTDYSEVKSYLKLLFREIDLLREFLEENSIQPDFREIHLGGGSPTYMDKEDFDQLIEKLRSLVDFKSLVEFSIEIDPRRVKKEEMTYYASKGINRISFGVQDFDLNVQKAINRVQPPELIERLLTPEIRQLFTSVNFDIICGLPRQTKESIRKTFERIAQMGPDRICLNYLDYAPKFAPHQLLMPTNDLPGFAEKKILFLEALQVLLESGYVRIGYDHFAKPTDAVAQAMNEKKMQWNALGYTPGRCTETIGVGVHSYSKIGSEYYSQSVYELPKYEAALNAGKFPIYRGHKLNKDDILRRDVIQTLRSYFVVNYHEIEEKYGIQFKDYFKQELLDLNSIVQDGLVELSDHSVAITEMGQQFANVICRNFDAFLRQQKPASAKQVN